MPRPKSKKPLPCDAQGCDRPRHPGADLCATHYRMENAPACGLAKCAMPVYASVVLTPAEVDSLVENDVALREPLNEAQKLGVCQAHYRRHLRNRERPAARKTHWWRPLNRPGGDDLVVVATRVLPSVKEALERSCPPGVRLYTVLHRRITEWAREVDPTIGPEATA